MLQEYYQDPNVRARMWEFLGGGIDRSASAAFITADDRSPDVGYQPRPVDHLNDCLNAGLDVGRSLWDRRFLLAHLDVEYVSFDDPAEGWVHPIRTFDVQRPVIQCLQETLLGFGIGPLHVLSGRGHHLIWGIRQDSRAFEVLSRLGRVPEPLAACYRQPRPPHNEIVEPSLASAFSGLGFVLEHVAHECLEQCAPVSPVPIQLTAVDPGRGLHGREAISIDLSEYGDPLYTRGVRMPFSGYLKPLQQRGLLNGGSLDSLPPLFMIPLHEMDEREGLLTMRDPCAVQELARRGSVRIPDYSSESERLIENYTGSNLASIHDWFYEQEQEPPERWPDTYDNTPLDGLPPCAREILEQPNDRLLKPAGIQHIVRVLVAKRWHPRQIAGLIRSKYERDFGWGDLWYRYNACSRADFYVRLFAGLIAAGCDGLVDFNCRSIREKSFCSENGCDVNLEGLRQSLAIGVSNPVCQSSRS